MIPAPVGARDGHQLEGIGGELAGVLEMRAAAEVVPAALLVNRYLLVGREVVHYLDLVFLSFRAEYVYRFFPRDLLPYEGLFLLDYLPHLLLDPFEVFGGEALRVFEVVVKPVVYNGADRDLRIGEEGLDGLGHDVRGRVTYEGEPFLGARLHGLELGVGVYLVPEIDESAVYPRSYGPVPYSDCLYDLAYGCAFRKRPLGPVGQVYVHFFHIIPVSRGEHGRI